MKPDIEQFTKAFIRAIGIEMGEMKRKLGSFKISLGFGRKSQMGEFLYSFDLPVRSEKIFSGMECELRHSSGRSLVTIAEVSDRTVELESRTAIPLGASPYFIVIYPWFLYERLLDALDSLRKSETHHIESAFRAFGRLPPRTAETALRRLHPELNNSQIRAVELSIGSDLVFVWGPPGTGKTTTLAHVLDELIESGKRVLVTSTTNAAVDQVLEKMVALGSVSDRMEAGDVLRAGSGAGNTFGTSIQEVVERLSENGKLRRNDLMSRKRSAEGRGAAIIELRAQIEEQTEPFQNDLFDDLAGPIISEAVVRRVFAGEEAERFTGAIAATRLEMLCAIESATEDELKHIASGIEEERISRSALERKVFDNAKLTLATMAAMYVQPALLEQRYDTVIIEEAGMAVLPTVFYCASLAREQVLIVGDPRQLPPIVQSRDPYVIRAMGRSIFDVTVPEPEESSNVALLDTQYRMHPDIGDFISEFFYGAHVKNGVTAEERSHIAGSGPYPGKPLILLDTGGIGKCETPEGSYSRYNEETARLCVELGAKAVGASDVSVAIIAPYVEQSRRIRAMLSQRRIAGIECRTIHRFQGAERDVVIFDMVDCAPLSPGKLLSGDAASGDAVHLLNVSLSRARGKLIVLADVNFFSESGAGQLVTDLLAKIAEGGKLIDASAIE